MNNLCIITYTHSNCRDIWKPYFDSLDDNLSEIKSYVFSNEISTDFKNHKFMQYNNNSSYCQEFTRLLKNIEEEYFIYMQEDFILYKNVDKLKIKNYIDILSGSNLSYIRLIKCGDITDIKFSEDLYYVSKNGKSNFSVNSFSMQPTIWKKSDFIELYKTTDRERFGEHIEYSMSMNLLNMNGVYCYNNEPKRGLNHYDSEVFPYIATAVVKGKWNTTEYEKELDIIFKKYNIDKNIRGVF